MPALPIADEATATPTATLAPSDAGRSPLTSREDTQFDPRSIIAADAPAHAALQPRQTTVGIILTYYRIDGPAPGAVVGIVLGSVAGFILLLWLLQSLTKAGSGQGAIAGEEEIVVRRPRRNSHSGRSRRSSTRTDVREYNSGSPRRSGGRSQIIVEERRPPRPRSTSIVVEARAPGDHVVEVIEEHDVYHSRRAGGRNSGYR